MHEIETLDALATEFEPDFAAVELTENDGGRPLLRLWLAGADLNRHTMIHEVHNLPGWASITGLNIVPGRKVPEEIDSEIAVCVYIQDDRDGEAEDVEALIASGLSPSEALDYWAVNTRGYTQTRWAEQRGIGQGSVSENVSKAKAKLAE